jgi:small subunit ribosomal protein S11
MTEEIVKKTENKPDEADQKSEVVDDGKKERTETPEATSSAARRGGGKKKKIRRQILKGQAHVQCTYNNTLVTFSDMSGKVLAWSSAGSLGFKGAKKATPYAATQIVNAASEKVSKYGLREIDVFVKGVGSGREASIRALVNNDFDLQIIKDITPVPHNGCRPKKPRRV